MANTKKIVPPQRSKLLSIMIIITAIVMARILIRIPDIGTHDSQQYQTHLTFKIVITIIAVLNLIFLYFLWKLKKWAALFYLILNIIVLIPLFYLILGLSFDNTVGGGIIFGLFAAAIISSPVIAWIIAIKNNWKNFT